MPKKSVKDFLIEWTTIYIKSRDAISKNIENIETNKADVYVTFKDSQLAVIVEPFLTNLDFLDKLKPFKEKAISTRLITANTKENFDFIISNWQPISSFYRDFNIYFVNPFSKLERKWIFYPQTHASIAGKGFERGLKTLFAAVEPITKKEFEKMI